jgi:WD40 repeat protein
VQICTSAKFSKDQKYIAVGLGNNMISILNGSTFAFIFNITVSFSNVYEIDWSWDSKRLLSCGRRGMEIFDVPTWSKQWTNISFTADVMACKFGWNGEFAGGDRVGNIFSFMANKVLRFINKPTIYLITALDFSP